MIYQHIHIFCPCGRHPDGYTHRVDTIDFVASETYTLRSLLDLHYPNASRSLYQYQIRYNVSDYLNTFPPSDILTLRKVNKKFFKPNNLENPLPDRSIVRCLSILPEPENTDNLPKYMNAIQYKLHIKALDRYLSF